MTDFHQLLGKEEFRGRHIGPDDAAQREMLGTLGVASLDQLIDEVVPRSIRLSSPLALGEPATELQATNELSAHALRNEIWRSFIGMGYYGTYTPAVIQRNVMENPGWYTAYTPYQAEISQGRLEALLNFQQMVIDLTGLPVANASLLDEATAAAEAMTMMRRSAKSKASAFYVDPAVHPQVLAVMRTRAKWLGIQLVRELDAVNVFGAHFQYPDTFGRVTDLSPIIGRLHAAGALASVGTDLLALVLLRSPGALGADIAIGSAQRFGVPMGFGGPHAAFMACRDELKRSMPGRIIGVSHDAAGRPALRMALQTREQHIRRDKATSNICTAQALLANMAGFYAVYHGAEGLRRIALRTNFMTRLLVGSVRGVRIGTPAFFDTVMLEVPSADVVRARAEMKRLNLRYIDATRIAVSFDETTSLEDVAAVVEAIGGERMPVERNAEGLTTEPASIPAELRRSDPVLTHPVFNRYHTETAMMRYLKRLENRDLSLVHSMIPLGSCTMKLNAAAELIPISWPKFAGLHPFVPTEQARGTLSMLRELEAMLAEITGFARVSLQPNSGAQGEYAGLLAIRNYLGDASRDICLIPASAHGTNPASATLMGLRVVVVGCDSSGNVDIADLEKKLAEHGPRVAVLMVTYPSTHGVFEEGIVRICQLVHAAGAQVYMDGANMNALTGLAKPALIGADVCHINLHKTFCIPHGGGGPGMGPIAVAAHLAPHLPAHPLEERDSASAAPAVVSSAPFGSALICLISWMYIRMMGAGGLAQATKVAILNANYVATRLSPYFAVLYKGANGRVAHECILDLRKLKETCGVTAEDVAKRLMDYGFHSPTLSFPVADTLMVEPTESESKNELDRFCHAMISIHAELAKAPALLKNAPHTALELAGEWKHPYSREEAVFPAPWLRSAKYWPPVKRIDNAAGDRQFVCTCPPIEAYA